jgi:lysophospholipase L1-like esterase
VKGAEAPYNEAARRVMRDEGVQLNDLCTLVTPQLKKLQQEGNPHFTAHGSAVLAREIARVIEAALTARPAAPRERSTP